MNKISVILPNHEMAKLKALGIYRGISDMSKNLRYALNFTTNVIADTLENNNNETIEAVENED